MFRSTDKPSMANLIRNGNYKMDESWNSVSENAKDLIRKMLVVNPKERITINNIKKHPWLEEVNNLYFNWFEFEFYFFQNEDIKNRVNALLESNMILTEENVLGFEKEPSPKRRRISESDE